MTAEVAKFRDLCAHSAFGPRFSSDDYAFDGNVATLRTTDISANGRIEYASMPIARLELDRFEQMSYKRMTWLSLELAELEPPPSSTSLSCRSFLVRF